MSFMFGVVMNLYEHQSTWNENMPLRGFFYFSELYQQYLNGKNIKLTNEKKRVMVPFPKYVVFYNGTSDMPDRVAVRLLMRPDRRKESPVWNAKRHGRTKQRRLASGGVLRREYCRIS